MPRATQAALAAKRATSSIPIVFMSADPVGFGLVSGLARPGGNLTGVSIQGPVITAKEMEAMAGALALRSLAYIHLVGARATRWYPSYVGAATSAAKALRVRIEFHEVAGIAAYEPLIEELVATQGRCGRADARYRRSHAQRARVRADRGAVRAPSIAAIDRRDSASC
jgi:hypothetical protein